MKNGIIVIVVLVLVACGKKAGNEFTVEGEIKNHSAKMIYLEQNAANQTPVIIDSFKLNGNKYSLKGSGNQQSIFSLRTDQDPFPVALFINDTKKIGINADLKNANIPYTIEGSPASQGIIDYDRNSSERAERIYQLSKEVDSLVKLRAPDSIINGPFGRYETEIASLRQYTTDFIEKAKSPVLTLYVLGNYQRLSQQLGSKGYSDTELRELVAKLATKFSDHAPLQELNASMKPRMAPDFSLPDTTGNPVALSNFKGKWVLVDFWASWCVPCRKENPNVVKAYGRFKDKNFTILGVSLDKTKEAWLAAIRQDGLTWTHISDLKYWNSAAAELYNVRSIPYNVLIDPQGKIIAENVMGQALERKLEEALK
jgi:peroxiredoxin